MNSAPRLSPTERDRFSDAVESSFDVSNSPRFFSWSQAALRALVPHEILICGVEDGSRQGLSVYRFTSTRYFREEHFSAIADPTTGLVPMLLAAANVTRSAVVFCPGQRTNGPHLELTNLVEANEMKNMVAHLVRGPRNKLIAFYAFARVSTVLDEQLCYVVELLGPHLHNAFLRVLSSEREMQGTLSKRSGRLVTPREYEILTLIKAGLTNSEIAGELNCSQWTIKNHVQAILRKLDSNTRTHAISRAMSLGILQPD